MEKKILCQKSKVKVVVRVRPVLDSEKPICVDVCGDNVQIVNHRNTEENLQYQFSSVFSNTATQHDVFSQCVEPLITNTLQGQNVSVFAYGPTGAGKTHTMLGVMSDPGIIPRTIVSLLKTISSEEEAAKELPQAQRPKTTVTFSYLEIYNEKVQDLLQSNGSDLPIREDGNHNIFVAGLTEKVIDSFETFRSVFGPASTNRTVAPTKLNEHSSRSHSIVILKVCRRIQGKQFHGKIYLIDLAGSEDNRRSGNKGIRLKESGAINKSLFVLGEVVDAINSSLPRVPYRNSKLTRLLQDSLGGSCHSVMVTNIAPEQHYYYDTYCTLNFASKSKKIVNVNTVNMKEDSPTAIAKPVISLKPTQRSSTSPKAKKKKPRRDSSISNSSANSSIGSTYVLPSPLVRRQAEMELVVNERLAAMENMIKEMKQSGQGDSTHHQTIDNLRSELSQALTTSSSLCSMSSSVQSRPGNSSVGVRRSTRSSLSSMDSQGSPVVICPTPKFLSDKTNILKMQAVSKLKHGKVEKSILKRKRDEGFSCSPLFLDTPSARKKKRSCKSNEEDFVKTKTKRAAKHFQHKCQIDRNADFLHLLNTAKCKELQQLQTVGVKRAKLIYEWRELHGPFNLVEDLKEIPGFTDKFIKNLLRNNLISGVETD